MAYVYLHRRLDIDEVFYVGIGKVSNGLFVRAYSRGRNKHWQNIVQKTDYVVEIFADDLSWESACAIEIQLIQEFGRKYLGTGSLVNMTSGGDGLNDPSQETRDKISVANRGKKMTADFAKNQSQRMLGNKLQMGRKHSEKSKQRMREKHAESDKEWARNPARIEKIRASKLGMPRSEETKEKLSKSMKGKSRVDIMGDERAAKEAIEKHAAKLRGRKRPKHSAFMKERMSNKQNNPMYGKNHTEEFKQAKREVWLLNNPGKNKSKEHLQKISNSLKGKPSPFKGMPSKQFTCPHCGKTGGTIMKRWHFDKCKVRTSGDTIVTDGE